MFLNGLIILAKMLYNRRAVKSRIPIDRKRLVIARKSPFFEVPEALRKFILDLVKKNKDDLRTVLNACSKLHLLIEHDDKHSYQGIRTVVDVIINRKGHCIEQNALLYVVMRTLDIPARFSVVKNPKGYLNKISEVGVHPLIRFSCRGKRYLADLVCGSVTKDNPSFKYAVRQDMTFNEFLSFYLLDGEMIFFFVMEKYLKLENFFKEL